jgi:DNA mismatch repair ATPase MutS
MNTTRRASEGLAGLLMFTKKNTHTRTPLSHPPTSTPTHPSQVHLAATITAGGRGLSFQHRVEEGPSDMAAGYGIALAAHCGLPECVLQEAERVKRLLDRKGRGGQAAAGGGEEGAVPDGASPAWQYAVMQRLMMLKGCLDPDSRWVHVYVCM